MDSTSHFFYHDNSYQQIWKRQENKGSFLQTSFGEFRKERSPFGYRSTLILVDHCDFDSVEKVEAIFYGTSNRNSKEYGKKGIIGTGLTITKTVFVNARGTENLGLEDPKYAALIKKLYKDGVEIAPHSLRPKTSLAKNDKKLEKDLMIMRQFKPKAWVDHGYVLHNLTRFGWDKKNKYGILDRLFKEGYRYYWSRIDYSLNAPTGNLNSYTNWGRAGKDYLKKVFALIKKKNNPRKTSFVFFWDFLGCLLGFEGKDDIFLSMNMLQKLLARDDYDLMSSFSFGPIKRSLLRIINPVYHYHCLKRFFTPDHITSKITPIYPVNFMENEVYFFDSLWINDCVGAYNKKNIDLLINEGGVHIGHNYLCVEENHYLSHNFNYRGGHLYINNLLQANLDYLAKCQNRGDLLVTTVSKFIDYFDLWSKVEVKRISKHKIWLKNHADSEIKGLTMSVNGGRNKIAAGSKKVASMNTKGRTFFWIDLKPQEGLLLEVPK